MTPADRDSGAGRDRDDDLEPASISITDCSLSFGDLAVLENVSLTIEPGEFVGFVGPNGAGKTTLLRLISGALAPDSGSIAIDGTDVHGLSSRASSRLVSVVPQDTTLSFSFPVRDVVEMGRHPHRSRFSSATPEDRAAVERALERTRTAELADRPIDEVSGGQRQRVVLARAIAQETPVMLLDEPTASLDVNHQVETLELVRELVEGGRTVVAAIHDLELAARYCDRLVLLADGRVAADGPPSSVLTREALADSFDANAVVTPSPVTGTETVTAFAADREAGPLPDRVHVLGTGTAAAGVIARLEAAGVGVSVGPVSSGDAAAETARSLGVETVETEPFARPSNAELESVESLIRAAGATVLADFVVGAGTQSLLDPLDETDSLVLVETRPFADRNFAGGEARERYERYRERGLEVPGSRVLEAVSTVGADRSLSRSSPPADSRESSDD
ncbi:heme ABC transporter ATP-binding protein [Natrinema thermotolerans]|uniref:Cobalamin import ATP-binding protein BtuD n=1 Tax=Natrinema thermotolerans TaxID=121872 RepID=A0AAF0PD20_9EURY|nr:heme ABC transporter ATP-binding protein [Natrinema thermotolerans]QCC60706.1 heme ABC transporter ATP-binding protein [Natrinema thermotolerans]QCC61585.1 heme ABC transporter ATP-binding protein [Natrinema thermotolerans]WMT07749.1 heme ABC transporter ATP-binding protein [Natrinema thermotolerans]WMT08381.1 heme ABC transporter ATP-binding protein [Natrinema thermotolerans]